MFSLSKSQWTPLHSRHPLWAGPKLGILDLEGLSAWCWSQA